MNFLEKELEQIIYETPKADLISRGLRCHNYNHILRQVNLGAYGIADLITVTYIHSRRSVIIKVYELKQNKVNVNSFMQAIRYCKGIQRYIDKYIPIDLKNTSTEFEIVLVGSCLDLDSDFCYLSDFVDNLSVYTYSYAFDGIYFKSHDDYYSTKESTIYAPFDIKSVFLPIVKESIRLSKEYYF